VEFGVQLEQVEFSFLSDSERSQGELCNWSTKVLCEVRGEGINRDHLYPLAQKR